MNHPSSTPEEALMKEGSQLLQAKSLEEAYDIFMRVADSKTKTASDEMRARGYQMAGVTARRQGNLMLAYTHLITARNIAPRNTMLRAAILRDLGAVQEALWLVTSIRGYLEEGLDSYSASVYTLEKLATMHRNTTRTEPNYKLQSELITSKVFEAMFVWRTGKSALRRQARELLQVNYIELKQLNAEIARELEQGFTTTTPYEVYQTNALMRVVRASSFFERIRHLRELWALTSESSASSGRRNEAIVALAGGDRLYRWFERRRMSPL